MTDQANKSAIILMADDDEDDCLLVREALKRNHIIAELRFVSDGRQLMEYLDSCEDSADTPRPDLILLDLNMPKQNGREALREIKSDLRLRSIPVVILTTSKAERDIELCYGLGANAYIIKPMSFEKLAEILKCLGDFWFRFATLPPERSKA
jgi:CheY-like chemotaxis protein